MSLPLVVMTGRVVDDVPNLRFVGNNAVPVLEFRLACNRRTFDQETKEWKNSAVCVLPVQAWRDRAENAAETISKGMMLTVTGYLQERSYEKDGVRRKVYEVVDAEVAVNLSHQSATVTRNPSKTPANVAATPPATRTRPAAQGAPPARPAPGASLPEGFDPAF